MLQESARETGRTEWSVGARCFAFILASTSIAALLVEFYGVCRMSVFTRFVFLPAMAILILAAAADSLRGNGAFGRAVWVGLAGGLMAAFAYDVFRLPFVFAKDWGIASFVPPMNLYKVFPQFGALILGQPLKQEHYSSITNIAGWLYHFSNGATFGVMYLALIGNGIRRHWAWGVLFATALEAGMLFTPYPAIFEIPVTARFVVVTLAAHALFGLVMGLSIRSLFGAARPGQVRDGDALG